LPAGWAMTADDVQLAHDAAAVRGDGLGGSSSAR
jgi:hypothetical protein